MMFKAPLSGDLNVRVDAHSLDVTQDSIGGSVGNWIYKSSFWAQINHQKPRMISEAETDIDRHDLVVTARYNSNAVTGDRLIIDGKPFLIFAVTDPEKKNRFKQYFCTSTGLEAV